MGFLSNDLLTRIHERAGAHDLANEFPVNDLKDLRETEYLSALMPEEYGDTGLNLEEIAAEQTRLAKVTPGIALSISMHQTIVGLGRRLLRNGDPHGEITSHDVAAGELYGFGIPEPGNDLVLFGSTTGALPDSEGGYSFKGVRVSISLAPMWMCLMTSGCDGLEEDRPRSVFATLKREDGGFSVKGDQNTLDTRVIQSNTAILRGAYAPEDHILTRCESGPSRDPVVFSILSHFGILLVAAYMGIEERAIEVVAEHVKAYRPVKNQNMYANDPDIRWRIAEATTTMNVVGLQIRELAQDIKEGVGRDPIWMPQLSAVKNAAMETSLRAVEQSIRAYGGGAYCNGYGLSRLYRDVLAGLFQPSDQELLHGAWAKVVLGPVAE